MTRITPYVRLELRFKNPGIFFLEESENLELESGIQLKESCLRSASGIQVPLRKNKESGTWIPESKTALDFLTRIELDVI